jgi:hypothetical protein
MTIEKIRSRLKSKPLPQFELTPPRQTDLGDPRRNALRGFGVALGTSPAAIVNAAGLISFPPATFGFAIPERHS